MSYFNILLISMSNSQTIFPDLIESSLSPVVADIIMERFEMVSLESDQYKKKVCLWHVDDNSLYGPIGKKNYTSY